MSDDLGSEHPRRRWEDLQHEIAAQLAQQMTPFRLTLDRLDQQVQRLKITVYGDAETRQRGLVERLDTIESKLDKLIDQSEARLNQWRGIRTALVIIAAISSVPTLQALGKVVGLLP